MKSPEVPREGRRHVERIPDHPLIGDPLEFQRSVSESASGAPDAVELRIARLEQWLQGQDRIVEVYSDPNINTFCCSEVPTTDMTSDGKVVPGAAGRRTFLIGVPERYLRGDTPEAALRGWIWHELGHAQVSDFSRQKRIAKHAKDEGVDPSVILQLDNCIEDGRMERLVGGPVNRHQRADLFEKNRLMMIPSIGGQLAGELTFGGDNNNPLSEGAQPMPKTAQFNMLVKLHALWRLHAKDFGGAELPEAYLRNVDPDVLEAYERVKPTLQRIIGDSEAPPTKNNTEVERLIMRDVWPELKKLAEHDEQEQQSQEGDKQEQSDESAEGEEGEETSAGQAKQGSSGQGQPETDDQEASAENASQNGGQEQRKNEKNGASGDDGKQEGAPQQSSGTSGEEQSSSGKQAAPYEGPDGLNLDPAHPEEWPEEYRKAVEKMVQKHKERQQEEAEKRAEHPDDATQFPPPIVGGKQQDPDALTGYEHIEYDLIARRALPTTRKLKAVFERSLPRRERMRTEYGRRGVRFSMKRLISRFRTGLEKPLGRREDDVEKAMILQVIIDVSGSMYQRPERIRNAIAAAVALCEASKDYSVDVEILASDSGNVSTSPHYLLKAFDEDLTTEVKNRIAGAVRRFGGENDDAASVRAALPRIVGMKKRIAAESGRTGALMLFVTDSTTRSPEFKKAVDEARKIVPVEGLAVTSESGIGDQLRYHFGETSLVPKNVDEFPDAFGEIIRKHASRLR